MELEYNEEREIVNRARDEQSVFWSAVMNDLLHTGHQQLVAQLSGLIDFAEDKIKSINMSDNERRGYLIGYVTAIKDAKLVIKSNEEEKKNQYARQRSLLH